MNYMKIKKNSIGNFAGISVSLYVSGCDFHCKNCFNKSSWSPDAGFKFTDEVKEEIFLELQKKYYDNFVILGGEPLYKHNVEEVTQLAKEFKLRFPDKKLIMFTGHTYENISNLEVMQYVDYLIDGLFKEELYSPMLAFRGSQNQRIIDIKNSILKQTVVLASEYYEKS